MNRICTIVATITVLTLFLTGGSDAWAGLVGINSFGSSALYNIDTTTGVATLRTTVSGGTGKFAGLAYLDGLLYATDVNYPPPIYSFGTIDPNTGIFTAINQQGGSSNWHGLAEDRNNGRFYSIDLNNNNTLVSVTPTGVISNIGTGTGINGRGMAFDDNLGILYATGPGADIQSLYTVSTTLGTSTLIGSTGVNSYMVGLAFDDSTRTLYMVADPDNQGPNSSLLYTLDVGTGAATLVGSLGVSAVDGLAYMGSQVPEPTTLFVWSGLVAIGAVVAYRRKRRAA